MRKCFSHTLWRRCDVSNEEGGILSLMAKQSEYFKELWEVKLKPNATFKQQWGERAGGGGGGWQEARKERT